MTIRPEVPHAEIVLLTLFQIRERPGQSSQRATTRVPTFFRVEREELPYKSARRLKKREEEEDGRTDERAGERTNERTKTAVEVAVVKKEKEEKKGARQSAAAAAAAAFVRSFVSLHDSYTSWFCQRRPYSLQPLVDSQMDK